MPQLLDITGHKFGRLKVLHRAGTSNGEATWACICECGKTKNVRGYYLRNGITESCGCLHREISSRVYSNLNLTHAMTNSREYRTWQSMVQRCCNQKHHAWRNYGGRGITICSRWRESFEAFVGDMGHRPPGMSIDRIDPDGNYEPGNCRWADPVTQRRNRSRKVMA